MFFNKWFVRPNLWSAAKRGDVSEIERLVASGHNVNEKKQSESIESATPLHIAAHAGQLAAVKALVKIGAKLDAKDGDGKTPLMSAATTLEGKEICDHLVDLGANVNAQDKSGMTALDYAALAGSVSIVKQLLSRGASPNTGKGNRRSSPVFHSVESRSIEVL